MKITYQKPEIVDLAGIDGLGQCENGSAAMQVDCSGDGIEATHSCTNGGSAVFCSDGGGD